MDDWMMMLKEQQLQKSNLTFLLLINGEGLKTLKNTFWIIFWLLFRITNAKVKVFRTVKFEDDVYVIDNDNELFDKMKIGTQAGWIGLREIQ